MAKRQLTKQQQRRVMQLQTSKQQTGLCGQVIARYGKIAEVEYQGQIFRCQCRQHLNDTVVGDIVSWQFDDETAKTGVILAIQPRRSYLSRSAYDGKEKMIAANIDSMLITVAAEPQASINVIDRYLVLAELQMIKPVIVCNKTDLLTPETQQAMQIILETYQKLQYQVLYLSAEKEKNLQMLQTVLHQKTSVFVGLSGVGKSSLLKALLPEQDIRIGDVKKAAKIGRHTTTTAQLYRLPGGGAVIDSPGIRELAVNQYNAEQIAQGFVEFATYLGQCKYRNCRHKNEPGCALLKALNDEKICQQRWQAYINLISVE